MCFSMVLRLHWLSSGGREGPAAEDVAKFAPRLRASTIWKSKSLKTDSLGHFWKFKSPKCAPRLRATTIWKSTSFKIDGLGALLEVDLEDKIVKN